MSNKIEQILSIIDIKDIREASSNYRRLFDEESILELSQSIKQHGVISPLLVRPIKEKKKTFYEVIAGSRRYKAAKMANIDELPVIIREMGDEEAFELQISENLQRKDVHPLDEAYAIVKFYEKGYTTEEVAKRLAKPASYITQRSKLSNLHFKLQPLFYEGKVSYTQAFDMARLEMEIQENFVEKYFLKADESELKEINVKQLVNGQTRFINLAPWNLSKEGIADKPACKSCPKNTECNLLLFPEFVDDPKCLDASCYDEKEKHFVKGLIEESKDKIKYYEINFDWKDEKNYKLVAEQNGLINISSKGYVIEPPEPIESLLNLEEYKKENKKSLENLDEEEIEVQYSGYCDEYTEKKVEYEKELKEFKKANKKGPWCLVLDGDYKFKSLPVHLYEEKENNSNLEDNDEENQPELNNLTPEEIELKINYYKKHEHQKLIDEFKRNVTEVLLASEAFNGDNAKEISNYEMIIFLLECLDEMGGWNDFDTVVNSVLNIDSEDKDRKEIQDLFINGLMENPVLINKMFRGFLIKLVSDQTLLFDWLKTLYPKSAEKLSEDLETKIQEMEKSIEEKFNQLSK